MTSLVNIILVTWKPICVYYEFSPSAFKRVIRIALSPADFVRQNLKNAVLANLFVFCHSTSMF